MSKAVIKASPMTEDFLHKLKTDLRLSNDAEDIKLILDTTHLVLDLLYNYYTKHHSFMRNRIESLVCVRSNVPKDVDGLRKSYPEFCDPE